MNYMNILAGAIGGFIAWVLINVVKAIIKVRRAG